MSEILFPLLILGALVMLNGVFVAASFGIVGVHPDRLPPPEEQKTPAARHVHMVVKTPLLLDRYIATAQFGITISTLALGMYSEYIVSHWLRDIFQAWLKIGPVLAHGAAFGVAFFLVLFSHVVVGGIMPKSFALHYAEHAVLGVDRIMRMTSSLFSLLVLLLTGIGNSLLVLLALPRGYIYRRLYSPEELELFVTESHKEGLLSDDERQIIQNIFDLGERRVGQVMTPRPRIIAIPLDIAEEDLRNIIVTSPHSRFPVYQGDLDHIVGLLLTKDFVRQQLDPTEPFDLKALLRQIPAVPEAMMADRLLHNFKHSHIHMALVFDEYGGTAGVVTLEDLVEEVIGEVHDEFDQVEQPLLHEVSSSELLARGNLMLDDLWEAVPRALPDYENEDEELPDVDTVGGLVVSLLGRPAQPGDHVQMQGAIFIVESVSGFAVDMVRIVLHKGEEHETPHVADDEKQNHERGVTL
jgi:CBS domain containing-hemolysin-like protein